MGAIRDSRPGPGGAAGDRLVRTGLAMVGVLLLAANLRAGITSVGPVLDEIRTDLGLGGATASLLISLPLVGFGVVSPLAPGLARRFGLERSLGGALGLLAVAIMVRSLPASGLIWFGTALLGAAVAIMNVLLPTVVKRDYPDRVGQLTGIYSAIQGGVAAIAAGFAVPIAGASAAGWRLSIGVWAGLALVGFAVFLPWFRRRAGPGARGGYPAAPPQDPELDTITLELPAVHGPGSIWTSMLAWQVTIFLGLQSTVYYVVITWWPSIEQSHGISASTAGWHQLAFQAFGISGALAAAALIHRWRSQSRLILAFAGMAPVAVAGQLLLPGAAVLWIVLLGLAGGATITIALSLFGLRTRNHHRAASLSGMAQSVGYLVAACGPVLIGGLHARSGSWTVPLLVLTAVAVVEVAFGLSAGRDRYVSDGHYRR